MLPAEVLTSALQALEAAAQDSESRNHAVRREGEARAASWQKQVGLGSDAVDVGFYCLEHSSSLRARFSSCKLLEQALPNCLAHGALSNEHIWHLRTQLLHFAAASQTAPGAQLLTSSALAVVAVTTVVSFALPPSNAQQGETSQAGMRAHGFTNAQREEAVGQLEALLQLPGGGHAETLVGIKLAAELIDRFDDRNALGAVKSSANSIKSLSWAEMSHAKAMFAEHVLPRLTSALLHLIDGALGDVARYRPVLDAAVSALSAALDFHHDRSEAGDNTLSLALSLPGIYNASFTAEEDDESSGRQAPTAKPLNTASRSIVLQPAVLDLLLHLLRALDAGNNGTNAADGDAADDDDAAVVDCRSCVEALAACPSEELGWLSHLLGSISQRIDHDPGPADCLFIARVLRTVTVVTSSHLLSANSELAAQLVDRLAAVAAKGAHFAIPSTASRFDLDAWEEAERVGADAVQEACAALLALSAYAPEQLSAAASRVFSAFTTAKIEGARLRAMYDIQSDAVDEEVQAGIKDRDLAHDVLVFVATLGRMAPATSLSELDKLFGQLAARSLNLIHREAHPSDTPQDIRNREIENATLHEQLHWAALIAGHLLADEGVGETPSIPAGFLQISQSRQIDDDALLQLSQSALHLFQSTAVEPQNGAASRCSPQVAEDLLWFVGRWSLSYLLIDASGGGRWSTNLLQSYGGDAGLGKLHELLTGMSRTVRQYAADDDVLCQMGDTLSAMSRSKAICSSMTRLRSFVEFVETVLHASSTLSTKATASLWVGILHCVANTLATSEGQALFDEVIKVTESRLRQVLDSQDFHRQPTAPEVVLKVNGVLDTYLALVAAFDLSTASALLPTLSAFAPVALGFLDTYRDAEDVFSATVEFFEQLVTAIEASLLDASTPGISTLLSTTCAAVAQACGLIQRKEVTDDFRRTVLQRLLPTLEHMLAVHNGQHPANGSHDLLTDALKKVCSLITPDMLKFPYFLTAWMNTLSAALKLAVERVNAASVEVSVQRAIGEGMDAGLRSVNEQDSRRALEAAEYLAVAIAQNGPALRQLVPVLEHAAQTVLTTLCLEACAASFVFDYVYIMQLVLRGAASVDASLPNRIFGTFAEPRAAAMPSLASLLERLAGVLMSSNSLVAATVRRDRGKLADAARDEAVLILREIRAQVRL